MRRLMRAMLLFIFTSMIVNVSLNDEKEVIVEEVELVKEETFLPKKPLSAKLQVEKEASQPNFAQLNVYTKKAETDQDDVSQIEASQDDVIQPEIEERIVEEKKSSITNDSSETEKKMWICCYLQEQGFTLESAAGIIGNIAVESHFDSSALSPLGYYGLCQWNTNWWYYIDNWMQNNGYDCSSFEGQVRAIVECSAKGQLNQELYEQLKCCQNVEQATELFCIFYEGCVGTTGNGDAEPVYYANGYTYQALQLRKEEAWNVYQMYKSGNAQ